MSDLNSNLLKNLFLESLASEYVMNDGFIRVRIDVVRILLSKIKVVSYDEHEA